MKIYILIVQRKFTVKSRKVAIKESLHLKLGLTLIIRSMVAKFLQFLNLGEGITLIDPQLF